jgi:hypothetical protein
MPSLVEHAGWTQASSMVCPNAAPRPAAQSSPSAHGVASPRCATARRNSPTGGAFVDAVAAWLGLEHIPAPEDEAPQANAATCKGSWARLGNGADPFGTGWAAILEGVLSGTLARRVRARSERFSGPCGEQLYSAEGAMEFVVPLGWIVTVEPEGHYRLSDPQDEMMISSMSYMRLPPLPPEAPNVIERLQFISEDSRFAEHALPIERMTRHDIELAWSEYRFDSKDTKRPEAAPRPARGRWLVAANQWTQGLVTGVCWVEDIAVAEQA